MKAVDLDRSIILLNTADEWWPQAFAGHLALEGRSERTIRAYTQDLRSFASWFEGENKQAFQPEMLTRMDIQKYRRHMDERQVSPSTWNRTLASLRVFCLWAVGAGFLDFDLTQGVEIRREEERPPRWLEKSDMMRVLRACEQRIHGATTQAWRWQAIRDQAMVYLMVYAGLREGEVAALDLHDVEISDRKGRVIIHHGKGDKKREIPLNAEVRRSINLWLDERGHDEGAMFPGKGSDRITTRTIQRNVAEIGQAAGVELSPHDLRHTFAKRMLDEGTPLTVVQRLLGHSRLETTARYVRPGWGDFEEAVEKI